MRNALTFAIAVAVLGLTTTGAAIALEQTSSLENQLQADAAAIQADKVQIDRDQQAGNQAALAQDKHQLFEATEKQESDRGTSENDGMNDTKRGW